MNWKQTSSSSSSVVEAVFGVVDDKTSMSFDVSTSDVFNVVDDSASIAFAVVDLSTESEVTVVGLIGGSISGGERPLITNNCYRTWAQITKRIYSQAHSAMKSKQTATTAKVIFIFELFKNFLLDERTE